MKKTFIAIGLAALLGLGTFVIAQAPAPKPAGDAQLDKIREQNDQILQKQDEILKKLDEAKGNVTRAAESFGFQADTDLDIGLRRAIEWYSHQRQALKFHR